MSSKYTGVIIAYDLAGSTGVAEACPGEKPVFSKPELRKDEDHHLDCFGRAIQDVAERLIAPRAIGGVMYGPGKALEAGLVRVVIEAPIMDPTTGRTNAQSQFITKGLYACVGGFAKQRGASPKSVTVNQCRKHFIGVGNLKSDPAKKAVMQMCRLLGWDPPTFDCSDAGAVWHWASELWHPAATPVVAGFFSRVQAAA